MKTHTVLPGECLGSIADHYGFTHPSIIYDHPANEALRRARPDPNVLLAGDEVVIPDRQVRVVNGATGQRYRFMVDRQPSWLRLRLLNPDGTPRAGLPYRIEYQGQVFPGTTGGDGTIVHEVPAWLPFAMVFVTENGREQQYRVALGYLDPVTDENGLRQRLRNLGYYVDVPGVPESILLRHAIHAYQHANDLTVNGSADTALYGKLLVEHCS
jgi:hypothetical protein